MPSKIQKMFSVAKSIAKSGDCTEANRRYRLGAVGIRADGTIVCASNITTRQPCKSAHAEHRVCQKLDVGAIIYVVRIGAKGELRMARPCKNCQATMKNSKVKRCYYSIGENEYGVIKF